MPTSTKYETYLVALLALLARTKNLDTTFEATVVAHGSEHEQTIDRYLKPIEAEDSNLTKHDIVITAYGEVAGYIRSYVDEESGEAEFCRSV